MGAVEDYLADLRVRQQEVWPPGIPREVEYPLGERPVTEYVSHWARTVPDRVAYDFYGRRITYAELDELAARFAGWLDAVGVAPGERVGVFLPNCPQLVVAMLGVLRAGAVYVPVNPMFREHELRHELADAGVSVLLSLDALYPLVEKVRPDTAVREVLVTALTDMLPPEPVRPEPGSVRAPSEIASGWARALAHPPAPGRGADLDALAALNYTGGTTGMPKGCEHTQRHMIYTAATAAAAAGIDVTGGRPEVFLIYVPIFWIAGEDFGILVPLFCGSTVVLLTRWDAGAVLEAVTTRRVTTMLGTVDNYVELMEHPDSGAHELSSLRRPRAMSFVRKLTPRLRQRWRELAGPGSVLREASYGMTETHTRTRSPRASRRATTTCSPLRCSAGFRCPARSSWSSTRSPPSRCRWARRGRSWSARRRCSPATTSSRRRPPTRCATAGCTPATSGSSTRTAACTTSAATRR